MCLLRTKSSTDYTHTYIYICIYTNKHPYIIISTFLHFLFILNRRSLMEYSYILVRNRFVESNLFFNNVFSLIIYTMKYKKGI